MFWETAKISGDLYAGHVAMSLGMYISERNEVHLKMLLSLNNNPALQVISGSLSERYNQYNIQGLVVVLIWFSRAAH
jgi:hypothetical protein